MVELALNANQLDIQKQSSAETGKYYYMFWYIFLSIFVYQFPGIEFKILLQ